MIKRYQNSDIEKIWSEENKLNTWLDVEIKVVEGWAKINVVPTDDVKKIKAKAKVDIARMLEIEKVTKHDVVAFTRMISESLGEEKKWIHLGLTSTDIVDTAQNILIKQSNDVLEKSLNHFLEILKLKAIKYKDVIITGRTHGIYGEPTSLGLKFLLWYEELKRQLERFALARKHSEVSKISGSMGNYANLEIEVEEYVAQQFGLGVDALSTQVTQRDRHAFLISVIANTASTFEKIATEIRLFQQSEIQEMSEGFGEGQKGSSSMPHKKNPISSENVVGLSRFIKSFVNMAFENNVLWHERDISHSSNERIMLPDIFSTIVYVSERLAGVVENIFVNENKIQQHLDEQKGIYFSQRVLTEIIKTSKVSREEIYDFIQKCTMEAMRDQKEFKEVLIENGVNKFVEVDQLNKMFDNKYFLRNVNKIFERVI
jgi:adenylosuccinate lyase